MTRTSSAHVFRVVDFLKRYGVIRKLFVCQDTNSIVGGVRLTLHANRYCSRDILAAIICEKTQGTARNIEVLIHA